MLGMVILVTAIFGMNQISFAEESIGSDEKKTEVTQTSSSEEVTILSESAIPTLASSEPAVSEDLKLEETKSSASQVDEPTILKTFAELHSAADIRTYFPVIDIHIKKEELDKYTDSQLENGMLLFKRYVEDSSEMPYASYVVLLNVLYNDQTISEKEALQQLSFVPNNFGSFGEMSNSIDQLQAYLGALYPSQSSFIKARKMTNSELIEILTYLDKVEKEQGTNVSTARIGHIIQVAEMGIPTEETKTSTSQTQERTTSSKVEEKTGPKKAKGVSLPQTGEEKTKWMLSLIGSLMASGVIIIVFKKAKQRK